jgi:predicted adenylyl cyclase CyaB
VAVSAVKPLETPSGIVPKHCISHMPKNIEIKAALPNRASVEERVAALAYEGPIEIVQDDTFFACTSGRLKLRQLSESDGKLIHYARANSIGPKVSEYMVSSTAEPGVLREVLARSLGVAGRVRKVRTLYVVGRTRVHLDQVAGLGDYLELEVVLRDDEDEQQGQLEAQDLMSKLGVSEHQLTGSSYLDLLAAKAGSD